MSEFDPETIETPERTDLVEAAPGSRLSSIRDRRKKALKKLHKDLVVPRYDPPIFVRFDPVEQPFLEKVRAEARASKAEDRAVIANAKILATACVGIFQLTEDGTEVSIDPDDLYGDWPKFDDRLGELIELDEPIVSATQAVRALYLTDLDIDSTVTELASWSGLARADLEREAQGN